MSNKTITCSLCQSVCTAPVQFTTERNSQSSFCSFQLYCSMWGEKKVLIKVVAAEGSPPQQQIWGKRQIRPKGVRIQSSLTRTCQTMRWLRSALARKGCSFNGGSSPSSFSPSSSPEERNRDSSCYIHCNNQWFFIFYMLHTHPSWSRCSLLLHSSPAQTWFLPELRHLSLCLLLPLLHRTQMELHDLRTQTHKL